MNDYTIREMTTDDLDRFRELYRDIWGYNRPEGFDIWRLFESPFGVCPTAVAMDGERFAGLYTLWPIMLNLGGQSVMGAQSMDTMIHPDHQRKGLFTKLALSCYDIGASRGVKAMYGFPNPFSYPGFVRRLNWDHTGDICHYVRPLNISAHNRIPGVLGPIANAATRLLPTGSRRGFRIGDGRPEQDELMAVVAGAGAKENTCRIERGPAWFDWRYAPAAENEYRWITARTAAGELTALAVWGMRSAAWGDERDMRAHLVELLGMSAEAKRAVLAATVNAARDRGAMVLETLCADPKNEPLLRRAGFLRHRQAPLITRKTTAENLPANVHDHAAWRIIGGDIDTF